MDGPEVDALKSRRLRGPGAGRGHHSNWASFIINDLRTLLRRITLSLNIVSAPLRTASSGRAIVHAAASLYCCLLKGQHCSSFRSLVFNKMPVSVTVQQVARLPF